MLNTSLSILLAYFLDILLGDPYWLPHPVRGIGKLINYLEKKLRKFISNQRLSGIILTVTLVGLTYLGVFFTIRLAEHINKWVGFATGTIFIYTTLSTRSLGKEAISVYQSLRVGNIKEARRKLSLIVGRDTQTLN